MGFALFKISVNGVARRLLCYPPEILEQDKVDALDAGADDYLTKPWYE